MSPTDLLVNCARTRSTKLWSHIAAVDHAVCNGAPGFCSGRGEWLVRFDRMDLTLSGMVRKMLPLGKMKAENEGKYGWTSSQTDVQPGFSFTCASWPVLIVVEGNGPFALNSRHVGPVVAGAREQHVTQQCLDRCLAY